jgi:hypothetical protein
MADTQQVDLPTVVGWGMVLMPLLTMWHEIGGHAALCAVQGGHVDTIGAFYVECGRLAGPARIVVSCAGVFVNIVLAAVAWQLWRRARRDDARLVLWLIGVSEAFVAAGYFCFSGVTGFGDLGTGSGGALSALPMPLAWRAAELGAGIVAYILLVRAAIRALTAMLGTSPATGPARRRIAHGYYATAGAAAVLTGLLNPVGIMITIMSAAASSFGGLAGFISIGFAVPAGGEARSFRFGRNRIVIAVGIAVLLTFALVLGPSRTFR